MLVSKHSFLISASLTDTPIIVASSIVFMHSTKCWALLKKPCMALAASRKHEKQQNDILVKTLSYIVFTSRPYLGFQAPEEHFTNTLALS